MSHNRRDRISEEDERHKEKDLLYSRVVPEDNQVEDQGCGRGYQDDLAKSQELHRRSYPDEFTDDQASVCDKDDANRKNRPADSEAFPDQVEHSIK